ncbi:hypothetical protein Droror1_Dr00006075 [Drosera rotundifolia]
MHSTKTTQQNPNSNRSTSEETNLGRRHDQGGLVAHALPSIARRWGGAGWRGVGWHWVAGWRGSRVARVELAAGRRLSGWQRWRFREKLGRRWFRGRRRREMRGGEVAIFKFQCLFAKANLDLNLSFHHQETIDRQINQNPIRDDQVGFLCFFSKLFSNSATGSRCELQMNHEKPRSSYKDTVTPNNASTTTNATDGSRDNVVFGFAPIDSEESGEKDAPNDLNFQTSSLDGLAFLLSKGVGMPEVAAASGLLGTELSHSFEGHLDDNPWKPEDFSPCATAHVRPRVSIDIEEDENSFSEQHSTRTGLSGSEAQGTETPSPSGFDIQGDVNSLPIATATPFDSVKDAVSRFGGILDWKAHKVQTAELRKIIEQELEKVQEKIPLYKEKSKAAEEAKDQVLKELESTNRLIEELELNLERAQTEENQAKQDHELAKLRVKEMEQGIPDEASVAAKAQLDVAKARQDEAVFEMKYVKDELENLKKEYASLFAKKEVALKKAEKAVLESREVEKTVEELTVELISTKESLESAHAVHLDAEEQRLLAAMPREQENLAWDKELKPAEEDLKNLTRQNESAKELKTNFDTATALLVALKAELDSYRTPKSDQENGEETNTMETRNEKTTRLEMQEAAAETKRELEQVKHNIAKSTDEVSCLKVVVTSLKMELEKERSELFNLKRLESMASVAVASLGAELKRIKSELTEVQMREQEAKERMLEFSKQLQHASQETDEAKTRVEQAREELKNARVEADHAKAGFNTMESRLLAAQKEIEAARAAENLALAAIKALQRTESARTCSANDPDSPTTETLSLDEYHELSKRANEAEEHANSKVANATSQIDVAKDSELKMLSHLEAINRTVAEKKEALRVAMDKAEKAKEGKLGVEQELRKWRAERGQQRKTGELGHGEVTSPMKSSEEGLGLINLEQEMPKSKDHEQLADTASSHGHHFAYSLNPFRRHHASGHKATAQSGIGTETSPEAMAARKKKSLIPRMGRVLMFLGKKRTPSSKPT